MIWDHEHIVVTPGAHFFSLEDGGAGARVVRAPGVPDSCDCLRQSRRPGDGAWSRQTARDPVAIRPRRPQAARLSPIAYRESVARLARLGRRIAAQLRAFCARAGLLQRTVVDERNARLASASCLPPRWDLSQRSCFGLLPTLQMVRRKKDRFLWHQLVVCAQVGASCVLLILAGLLVRATLHTLYSDPGFGYEQVLSIDPGMSEHGFTSAQCASLPRSAAEPAAGRARRDVRLHREDSSAGEHTWS